MCSMHGRLTPVLVLSMSIMVGLVRGALRLREHSDPKVPQSQGGDLAVGADSAGMVQRT
jgi:hypothetical protein